MSNETTNPVVKWILIGVIVVSVCVVGALFLIGTKPVKELRAADELEKRGYEILYYQQGYDIWTYPGGVIGEDQSITEGDSRLICQLPHMHLLNLIRCDLSGLNLDNIGNCQKLDCFQCNDVTQFPADEISKLAACPIKRLILRNACVNDSNLEVFAKWMTVDYIDLENNSGITDAGLNHLEKIVPLQELYLIGTSVTKEGVEEFMKKRPDVKVEF